MSSGLEQSNYRSKHPQLGKGSNEWVQLEYDLQLGLGSIAAVIKEVHAINNQSLQFQFEKHNSNKLILESWIAQESVQSHGSIEDICIKGFEFKDNKGFVFPTGFIDMPEMKESKNQNEYTVMMFKIAVGRSQCVPCRGNDYNSKEFKLQGSFDSIYLYDDEQDKQGGVFLHRYILFQKEQVLPMYKIVFYYDNEKEQELKTPNCQNCNDNQATMYCYNDEAHFCNECHFELHQNNSSSYSVKHRVVEISKKEKSFGFCQTHELTKLELYCTPCHVALCVYCKIQQQGSHFQGEPAGHSLIKISDAYKKAIHESKVLDPLLEKRKNELSDQLNQIDQKIRDVNAKASQIEEKIYKLLQDGLESLQERTKEKMCILIGDQLELKRQYDQIQWMEQFLKFQQNVLNPSDYLKAWSRHSALRSKIILESEKSIVNDISPEFGFEAVPIRITNDTGHTNLTNLSSEPKQDINQQSIKGPSTLFRSHILGQKNSYMRSGDKNANMLNIIATKDKGSAKKGPDLMQASGLGQNTVFSNRGGFAINDN